MTGAPIPLRVPPWAPNHWLNAGIIRALGAFTVLTCMPTIGGVPVDIGSIVGDWSHGATKVHQFLQPDFSFLLRTAGPMVETFAMAVAAAASIPLTLRAARSSNPKPFTRQLVRCIVNANRAVPDVVYALVLAAILGVGALPGFVPLLLFDVGVVVKLVSEAINSTDHDYIEAKKAAGGSQPQINRATVTAVVVGAVVLVVAAGLDIGWTDLRDVPGRIAKYLGLMFAGPNWDTLPRALLETWRLVSMAWLGAIGRVLGIRAAGRVRRPWGRTAVAALPAPRHLRRHALRTGSAHHTVILLTVTGPPRSPGHSCLGSPISAPRASGSTRPSNPSRKRLRRRPGRLGRAR